MESYPRGSEWRRWDLHIHTPETKKNDCFEGKTSEEKWNNFYNTIDRYIGDGSEKEKSIAAIGVTDYLSIDNYKKIVNDNRLNKNIKLVLPNVELRLIPLAKKTPVNIHCIFNPEIANEIEDRFFANLEFSYGESTYSATRSELERLGRAVSQPKNIEKDEAYALGLEQFVVDISTLSNVFEKDKELRENTIIVVSNNSADGASGITAHSDLFMNSGLSQTEATRRKVYQISDLIFSAQESDRKYFLGQSADDVQTVVRKCGSLKGCIHGSDAHTNSKIFEPDGNRYCWIKADPTFNGLKQIVYEPETRICISPVRPEEKPEYQVIDYIEIGDEKAQKEKIVFNDKLTCIIGGKSTGKSLLLHNLAMAIDPAQVKEKAEITHSRIEGRNLDNVVVQWKDGKNTNDDSAERKIVYIPQTYLNRLSDENEEITEIDEIIKNVVLISPDAKAADGKMQESLKNQKIKVERLVYEVLSSYETINEKKEEQSDIGSKEGINKELKKLNDLKKKHTKESSLTDEEIAEFNDAVMKKKDVEHQIEELIQDMNYINSLDSVFSRITFSHKFDNYSKQLFEAAIQEVEEYSNELWSKKREYLNEVMRERRNELENVKSMLEKKILSLQPKIDENESIRKISEAIQIENSKLKKVTDAEEEINELRNNCSTTINELVKQFFVYKSIREEYQNTINNKLSLDKDGLSFFVETPFRMDAFQECLLSTVDNRSLKANREWIDIDSINVDWITEDNINNLVVAILDERLKVLKKKSIENALRELLGDWNNTTYRVSMDGDQIDGMSPGKKALVLLKLLINLAESRCPILIDQPEDDLDNRSVFEELIPFIKEKKIQRQIIIVTHNANVVLGGDAEEIIVANQDGKNSPNKQYKFEYRSGAIEEDRKIDEACILNKQGIQQHICDILEGGETAFDLRKHKYQI